jgi:hypothetical protein
MATKTYKVTHSFAGPFQRDEIVSESQIKEAGADTKFWLKAGAIEEVKEVHLTRPEKQGDGDETLGELEEVENPKAAADAKAAIDAVNDAVKAGDAAIAKTGRAATTDPAAK